MRLKTMTMALCVLAISALVATIASCSGNNSRIKEYRVTCRTAVKHDTARLYVLSEPYGELIATEAKTPSEKGNFVFTGTIDGEHVACIRFNNDNVPLYFVLSPDKVYIDVTERQVRIKGNAANARYLRYLNRRHDIETLIASNSNEYRNMAGNFTLTAEKERQCLLQDSLLRDSLHRVTVDFINLGTPEATIVKHRFINTLPVAQARRIKVGSIN